MTRDERDRPSEHGKILGEALSDLVKAGSVGAAPPDMCATCAFREGCMTNQMAATGKVALNCIIGVDDAFFCHHGMKDGEPTKLCAGFAAARHAPFEIVKSTVMTVLARLQTIPEQDEVRAAFDEWWAKVDPDGALDNYQLGRAYEAWRRRAA